MKLRISILQVALIFSFRSVFAGSATWLANPSSSEWNDAANWTSGGPPNGQTDIAIFQSSALSSIEISRPTPSTWVKISGINFTAGSGLAYTLNSHELVLSGSGIVNNSGLLQSFVALGGIFFSGDSRAGDNTAFTVNYGPGFTRPEIAFVGNSSAGSATFTVKGSTLGDYSSGGTLEFSDTSSADNATIIVNGSAFRHPICPPGHVCLDYPYPAGFLFIYSTAGNATLIANGGTNGGDGGVITCHSRSTGGTARVKLFGNGNLDIGNHDDPSMTNDGLTIGSLEGDGIVFLGSKRLTIGSNGLSTSFHGIIPNIDRFGIPLEGSLSKIGAGTLTLSGINSYTGPTTITGGVLEVDGSIASPATVNNGGTLGGSGTTQSVTVNSGGTVAPGGAQTLHVNGNYAQNAGGVFKIEVVGANPDASGHLEITGNTTLDGTLEIRFENGILPLSGQVFKPFHVGGAVTGAFSQIIFPDLRAGFQFQTEVVNGTYQITALNDGVPATGFRNISTRLKVGAGDDALIGGFIVQGNVSKKVIVRAIGPSLTSLPGRLADPTLELRDSAGALIFANDNWMQNPQSQEIVESGLAPSDDHEAAIVAALAPGSYTAVMRGAGNTTGIGVVEVYDITPEVPAKLANISSRGLVETGDNVMIGGFITDNQAMHVLVRALGPSLTPFGIANPLADPTLALHNAQGAMIASNDDWTASIDRPAIETAGLEPPNEKESAIPATLSPGNYTAIVRGKNDTVGVALVEVYHLL